MREGIAMGTGERICPKLWLMFLRSHGLHPATEHLITSHRILQRQSSSGSTYWTMAITRSAVGSRGPKLRQSASKYLSDDLAHRQTTKTFVVTSSKTIDSIQI